MKSTNIKFYCLFLLTISFIFSCSKNNEIQLVEKEKFVKILFDLHLTDALMANRALYDGQLKDSAQSYYNFLFKKYNITRADFDYSLDYFSNNPLEFLKIYDEIIAEIKNRIPKQLNRNSIFNIFDKIARETEIRSDLNKYYGTGGRDIWIGMRSFIIPQDTAKAVLNTQKDIDYQCLVVFGAEIMVMPTDSSKNLRMELEMVYKDSSRTILSDTLNFEKEKWNSYRLLLVTDSLKKPMKINAIVAKNDNNFLPVAEFRNLSLKQYAPDKDTSELPPVVPEKYVSPAISKHKPIKK